MYFVQLEFFAIIMVNAKEFLIFRVSLDNQTEPIVSPPTISFKPFGVSRATMIP